MPLEIASRAKRRRGGVSHQSRGAVLRTPFLAGLVAVLVSSLPLQHSEAQQTEQRDAPSPPELQFLATDDAGRTLFTVSGEGTWLNSLLYVYERPNVRTLVSEPADWLQLYPLLAGNRHLLVATKFAGRGLTDVVVVDSDGTESLIRRERLSRVAPSPVAPVLAIIRETGRAGRARQVGLIDLGEKAGPARVRWWSQRLPHTTDLFWTRGGELIAVEKRGSPGSYGYMLVRVDLDTAETTDLWGADGRIPFLHWAWPGQSGSILVRWTTNEQMRRSYYGATLGLLDVHTGHMDVLLTERFGGSEASPSGTMVAFGRIVDDVSYEDMDRALTDGTPFPDPRSQICVLDGADRSVRALTSGEHHDHLAGFAGADQVVYWREVGDGVSLRACRVDGTDDRPITEPQPGELRVASVSSDTVTCFVQTQEGVSLHIVAVDGSSDEVVWQSTVAKGG